MANGRFHRLIQAYADRAASPEEERELFSMLGDSEGEFKDFVEELAGNSSGETDWERVYSEIRQRAGIRRPVVYRMRWVVAAAVLVLVASLYIIIERRHAVPAVPVVAATQDVIPPAMTRAHITLADGRQIGLDSATQGTLVREGKVEVVKLADGSLAYTGTASRLEYNTLTNPRGSKNVALSLSDGTRVWLNCASSIRYPTAFTSDRREVEIDGEAYFEVAPDAHRPFVVKKGNMMVDVLGTRFNVHAYKDEPAEDITLVDGAISVDDGDRFVILKPGQQAAVEAGNVRRNPDPDLESVLAWRNGRFSFVHADLPAVLREISRWYDVDVVYEGNPAPRSFHADLSRTATLSQLLTILQVNQVHYRLDAAMRRLTITP